MTPSPRAAAAPSRRPLTIGFATCCMNRAWQLKETLSRNLAVLRGTGSFLALANFNSQDGLDEWVLSEFGEEMEDGRLLYFRTTVPQRFHASVAKNLAHRIALSRRPDVLFNLDADNFVAPETLAVVETVFARFSDPCFQNWTGRWKEGSFGRIALRAETWVRVGGYHEGHYPIHGQDDDLLRRSVRAGAQLVRSGHGAPTPVPNSPEQKIENLALDGRYEGLGPEAVLSAMNRDNKATFAKTAEEVLSFDDQARFPGTLNGRDMVCL